MGFLLEFDSEFGGLRFWLIWLLGFDEDDDEKDDNDVIKMMLKKGRKMHKY
jgi:hypothetical protein